MYMERYSVYMSVRHKHLMIDQRKLDRAKRILGLSTERQTVDRALDAVLAEDAILRAHRKARSVGGLVDAFGPAK
jgi:Arc/MetJ family transcription regulator